MRAAIIASLITMVLTLITSRYYFTKQREAAIDKHDELVKPIADEAFLEGFEKGWESAINDRIAVKNAYDRIYGLK